MQDPASPWPPRVGDRVGIKGSRLIGLVRTIAVSGDVQRFVVSVRVPDTVDPNVRLELVAAAERAHTVYTLDELEPARPPHP